MITPCIRFKAPTARRLERGVPLVLGFILVLVTRSVAAETFCVGTESELEAALTNAESNGTSDYILLQSGTYTGDFSFESFQHHPVTIRGGYNSDCSARVDDPNNTVLDSLGAGTVLSLYQHAGGGVSVEGLTIQNGSYNGLWIRLVNEYSDSSIDSIHLIHNVIKDCRNKTGVSIASKPGDTSSAGNILIYDNVIQGFTGEFEAITVLAEWALPGASLVFRNNIIAGNVSTSSDAGLSVTNSGTGNIYLTNNTIVDNESSGPLGGLAGGLSAWVGSALYAYNNIIYGNVSANGPGDIWLFYLDGTGVGTAYSNIYTDIDGSWDVEGANMSLDPGFVGPGFWHDNGTVGDPTDDYWVWGDYHLGASSPCIDAGSDGAPYPGDLPTYDFEGDPRVMDGNGDQIATVDIGADELPLIFADGFETGNHEAWSDTVP
jgi:hypothetical protein